MVEDGVCVVTHPLSSAGENAARSLLEILAEITSVSLITADLPDDSVIRERHDVIEVNAQGAAQDSLVLATIRFILNQLRMVREISRREEEVVLFFGATAYILPILAAKLLGRTVVLEPRGDVPLTLQLSWEQRIPGPVARLLARSVAMLESAGYRLADAVITYTPSMAEELGLERYGEKLFPNGARFVDTELFYPRIPFEERDRVIGFIGRLDEEKGIRVLAEVAKRLSDDVTFVFVGDGELREWLETELSSELESGSVEVTGWIDHDEVAAMLNRFKLLVLPSAPTEGLPTVALEALASGTPVYATPVAGVSDVVREGETGMQMERLEPAAIAERIEVWLDRPDGADLGSKGRRLVETEYSFEAATDRYRSILTAITT